MMRCKREGVRAWERESVGAWRHGGLDVEREM